MPGNKLTQRADCPFCGLPLTGARVPEARRPGEMPVGACSCGAVYAYDVTGHNLGAAFIEALVFACNLDWDLAWGLVPEDDYLEQIVENYDGETNLVIPGGSWEGRKVRGALYFIRLHQDIRDVTGEGVQRQLARRDTPVADAAAGRTLTPREVAELVGAYRVAPLLAGAGRPKKLIRDLQRLLYSGDELLRLRAAEILGRLAAARAEREPDPFAGLLQRLFSSLEDPGAFCPGALDAVGEIIGRAPRTFAGWIPTLVQYLRDDVFRPGVLRALNRIVLTNPDLLRKQADRLVPFLHDESPETRGYAAALLGRLRLTRAGEDLRNLQDDQGEIWYYTDGAREKKTVGQLAATALQMLEPSQGAHFSR